MIGASLAKATLAPKSRRPRATRAGIERPGVEILAREFEPVSSARRSRVCSSSEGRPLATLDAAPTKGLSGINRFEVSPG